MISNNYIPEKINDANAYLDGTQMIGVAASVDLPEVNMKTGTVEGFGVGGEIDSPTIGQWESFEQEVQFNTLYSSAVDMLNPLTVVNLTFRAAQQVYDKTGGYDFKGLRVVEMGRVKKFKPGKIEKSEGMEATVTLELTYIMIEVDGEQLIEIDKLNGVYNTENHIMRLEKPYYFEGKQYTEIDLNGVADLNSLNESAAENRLTRAGFMVTDTSYNYLYACILAGMATGLPEEFFTGLPLYEVLKIKNAVNDAGFFE